jgi:formamidopyrimidine-DNA glycosylase
MDETVLVPELVEVEAYRALAEKAAGRTVDRVHAPDAWYLKRGLTARSLRSAVRGREVQGVRRIGKLLLLDTTGGPTVGLRFGMTGRLHLDGVAGVDRLIYSSNAADPAWERLVLGFADGGRLVVSDPRRLGGVELDPPEHRLGPDAATITTAGLRPALAGSGVDLKARLMDQSRVAGIGNLLADEILWRAGLSPVRPAGSLTDEEVRRLAGVIRRSVALLVRRGGSHTGDLMAERRPGGVCPADGSDLVRGVVGGRTTWWCPAHQA